MGKVTKSTKKFLKNKLKGELESRKKRKEKHKFTAKKKPEEIVEESSEEEPELDTGFIDDLPSESDDSMSQDEDDEEDQEDQDDLSQESDFEDEETMQLELQRLQETDPKFYDFLKENDSKLLEFEVGNGEDTEIQVEEEKQDCLSKEMVHKLRTSMSQKNSLKAWYEIVRHFKDALELDQDYSDVFNLIILTTLKYSGPVLNHHLNPKKPSEAKKWKKIRQKVKSFLSCIVASIQKLTSLSMKRFVIKQSEHLVAYFNCFPKVVREYIKELVHLWASSEQEQIRIVSFLFLRKMAVENPNPYLNIVFKMCFTSFMEFSRHTTPHSWVQISFMTNCIVEIGGLSLHNTYQHTFVYLRQLAMKLRQASTAKTKENFKLIYNWQFLHAIRLWTLLLCTYCDVNQVDKDQKVLKPLIYPLVQIMIGVMRLKPSSKHFPLRLSIIKSLIEITDKTKTYIPVASFLLEIFESSELKNKPKPSTLKPLDFKLNIRAPNNYLGTKAYHQGLVEEVIHLLFEYYACNCKSIGFPELAVPAVVQLKRMMKNSTDFTKNKHMQQLIEKLDQNSKFIEQKRQQVSFGPKNIEQAIDFLSQVDATEFPIYKYNQQRLKVLERRAPKEMMVAEGDDTDSETETVAPKAKPIQSKKNKKDVQGSEDLVEDFELSEDEEL